MPSRGHRRRGRQFSLLSLACVLLWSATARAAPSAEPSRDAWLISAEGRLPALMLGPSSAMLPPTPAPGPHEPRASGPWLLCAELGCSVVTVRSGARFGAGLEVRTAEPVSAVSEIWEYEPLVEALAQSKRLRDFPVEDARMMEYEMPNSLADPPRRPRPSREDKRRDREARKKAKREGRPARVEWSDPGPWTGEFGLMGGAGYANEGSRAAGFGSARAGFRFRPRRRSSSSSKYGLPLATELVRILGTGFVGNHFGADVQLDLLGARPGGYEWALTLQPSLAVAFPRRKAFLAWRVPALTGLVAVGVGGSAGRTGFVVALNPRVSLLATRRFGLDMRCTGNVNYATDVTLSCGLGGFVR